MNIWIDRQTDRDRQTELRKYKHASVKVERKEERNETEQWKQFLSMKTGGEIQSKTFLHMPHSVQRSSLTIRFGFHRFGTAYVWLEMALTKSSSVLTT